MVLRLIGYVLAAFMAFMGVQKFIGDVPIFAIIEANTATQWASTCRGSTPGSNT
jgi:hypothetical protein